jgi:hypothetical protein
VNVADVEVEDPAGNAVRVGDLIDRPTLLLRVRYFG